jgi:hypothetical protein
VVGEKRLFDPLVSFFATKSSSFEAFKNQSRVGWGTLLYNGQGLQLRNPVLLPLPQEFIENCWTRRDHRLAMDSM